MFVPTKVMFRLMMMVFVRTSELTETPWSEIDLERKEWIIDWHRMKMRISRGTRRSGLATPTLR
jgi:hypothetical protein